MHFYKLIYIIPLLALVKLGQLISTSEAFDQLQIKYSSEDRVRAHNEHDLWKQPCQFKPNGTGPLPVVLMALGRSGSSVTWDTMSQLTGQRNMAYEVTGGNRNSSKEFFNDMQEDELAFHNWTMQRLCHIQQNRPDISSEAGIAGFQWKPYMSSFDHEYAIAGLKIIGETTDPLVKVVYLTRNPLDRKLSNIRHTKSKQQSDKKIEAHCAVGDAACIKKHSQFDTNTTFPTGDKLKLWLENNVIVHDKIIGRLEELNIPYVEISYKNLYSSDDAEEWMRIFRFLGRGPAEGLTMDDVGAAFSMASTHTQSRNETITNFEDVKKTLVGTEYEYLLGD